MRCPLKSPSVVEKLQVRYQDLGPYGHVNQTIHMGYFESARLAYWNKLAEHVGLGPLVAGNLPGVSYVFAEATVKYRSPIYIKDTLFCAASIHTVGSRSFTMDYELRSGESFEEGRTVAEGMSAQVFFDPNTEKVHPRPEWFLSAVAAIEGRPEESFAPPQRESA